jgi:hypothetical protein
MDPRFLNIIGRGIFHMLGMDPETVKQQLANKARQTLNQQPINAQGQTRTTNRSGQTRDFRNPKQSATRRPTLDPVQTRSRQQATPPNRPSGGFGQSPGQLSIPQVTGGNNPSARPGGRFTAPRVGVPVQAGPGPDIPVASRRFPQEAETFRQDMRDLKSNQFKAGAPQQRPGLRINQVNSRIGGGPLHAILNTALNSILETKEAKALGDWFLENTTGRLLAPGKTMEQVRQENAQAYPNGAGWTPPSRQIPAYSGMEDMSGDPILPTKPQVQMGRPDPSAPVDYQPAPQPAPQPAAQPAPRPVAPSRKQIANDAYDALRIQFNAGEITADQFAKEGMKIHKKYFDKK